ncbi:hypothetical protein Taro_037554, partial [Colocasia esculenta]|nr:hypothetical protein [Colocasia esculenta]
VAVAGAAEVDGKPDEGKERSPIKGAKGSLGSLNVLTGKNSEREKTSGVSTNGLDSQRGAIHPPFAWPNPVGLGPARPTRARDRRVGSSLLQPMTSKVSVTKLNWSVIWERSTTFLGQTEALVEVCLRNYSKMKKEASRVLEEAI